MPNPFTFQGFDARTELLRGPVKPKKLPPGDSFRPSTTSRGVGSGATAGFLRRVNSVSKKTPEAMVRITGGAKGKDHVKEHLAYITRNGKLEATDEQGDLIRGGDAVRALAKQWTMDRPDKGPDTRNLMLSMPKGTDPDKVLRAAKTFADKEFAGERQYLLALHTDRDHPHVHLTLKRRGLDGQNLNPTKADLQHWREGFAHELRQLGVAAEATPRRARGVILKPKNIAVHHMEQDHKAGRRRGNGEARAPAVQLQKYADAVKELTGKDAPKVRPWELKIAERQEKIRSGWLATAAVLDVHGSSDSLQLSKQIRAFVAAMPPIKTERQNMLDQVSRALDRTRQREQGQDRA